MNATLSPQSATVLRFAFREPMPIQPVDPMAPPEIQEAQALVDRGLYLAESNARACGLTPQQAQHATRVIVASFLSALDGESIEAGRINAAFVDWLNREGWRIA